MSRVTINIREPVWNGGEYEVGVANYRMQGHKEVAVTIDYKDESGELVYPHTLVMDVAKARTYPVHYAKRDVMLYVIPINDFDVEQVIEWSFDERSA